MIYKVLKQNCFLFIGLVSLFLSACSNHQTTSSSNYSSHQTSPQAPYLNKETNSHERLPKNSKLLFVSNQDGDREIFITDLAGSQVKQLTHNKRDDSDASWSPDGRYILFTSNRDNGNSEIYLMNADGSNQINLSMNPFVDNEARWSPDGESIVFISDREGQANLFVMSKDGSNVKNLSQNNTEWAAYGSPSWSPNGKLIAYRKYNKKIKADLWLVDPLTGQHQQINNHPKYHDGEVSWSPDSSLLVYHSRRNKEINIYQYDIERKKEIKLTHLPSLDSQPVWSNQGKSIVFLSTRGASGHTQVFIMNHDGTQPKSITDNGYQVDDAIWLNDDSGILYVSWQVGRVSNVFLADLATGEKVAIAPAKGYQSQPLLEPAVLSTRFSNHVSLSSSN